MLHIYAFLPRARTPPCALLSGMARRRTDSETTDSTLSRIYIAFGQNRPIFDEYKLYLHHGLNA